MVFEILATILATSTARSVIKFVDEKIAEYVNKKYGDKPPGDIEALKKEVRELKEKLDTKEKADITQIDVEDIKRTIAKIKQKQSSLPDPIISDSNFSEWNDRKLKENDLENQAPIVRKELELLLETKLRRSDKDRIFNISVAIEMNYNDMKKWTDMFAIQPLSIYDQKAKIAEIALRRSLYEARNILKPYYDAK